MAPVLFLFMVMDFSETLEKEWAKAGLQMVNFRQHTHSPRDVVRLTGHKKKTFEQGTIIYLFCVLYVDNGEFPFEDRDQLTLGISLIYSHFTRFGLGMYMRRGEKSFNTECVFFPPPGFFGRKYIMPADNRMGSKILLVPKEKTKRELYVSRHKREEKEYGDLPETKLIVVCDGFVTFCRHFKYLGNWISFSLRDEHNVAKIKAAANTLMCAMSKI